MQLSVIISVLLPLVAFFNIGDCAGVTAWVNPEQADPSVTDCGTINGTIDTGATGAMTVTIEATDAVSYTATATPADLTFTIANDGVISLVGTIAYATTTEYVVTIIATAADDSNSTCIAKLSVNDQPAFPPDTLISYCVSNGSAVDTAIATITATNVVGTMVYSITSGDTNSDLAVAGATGAITAAKELTTANDAEYQIVYEGADGSLTATTTITITVGTCAGASAILASFMPILLALFATLK